ncbi:hypothetical protein AGMMS49982_14400 [Bacteroidia bacterium]|nr:hypothetical protein AGMMS49982_14400 [Bacteroidia bacterium]
MKQINLVVSEKNCPHNEIKYKFEHDKTGANRRSDANHLKKLCNGQQFICIVRNDAKDKNGKQQNGLNHQQKFAGKIALNVFIEYT